MPPSSGLPMAFRRWACWPWSGKAGPPGARAKKRLEALEEDNHEPLDLCRAGGRLSLVLAFFLFHSLFGRAPDLLPSALIDKPAPGDRPAGDGCRRHPASPAPILLPAMSRWSISSPAGACPAAWRAPQLMTLSKMPGITLYGVDYEERQPGAGRAFLDEQGNPFSPHRRRHPWHAPASIGASMACPRPMWWTARASCASSWWAADRQMPCADQLLPEIEKATAGVLSWTLLTLIS